MCSESSSFDSRLRPHEFPREMFDRGQYRIGRSPSQGTKTGGLHGLAEVGQEEEILREQYPSMFPKKEAT